MHDCDSSENMIALRSERRQRLETEMNARKVHCRAVHLLREVRALNREVAIVSPEHSLALADLGARRGEDAIRRLERKARSLLHHQENPPILFLGKLNAPL